jgi:hypothetical protein
MTAATLPIASIVAFPGLGGTFLKERDDARHGSAWTFCDPYGARTAYDAEVDEALVDGATVLRNGA